MRPTGSLYTATSSTFIAESGGTSFICVHTPVGWLGRMRVITATPIDSSPKPSFPDSHLDGLHRYEDGLLVVAQR